jgi:hypothetical protein
MGVKNISQTVKARQVRSNVKVMLSAFFDYEGVVYHTFVPRRQTVNEEYSLEVLKSLREAVRKKRPDSRRGKMDASRRLCTGARIVIDPRVS